MTAGRSAMLALALLGAAACHRDAGPLPMVDHAWLRLAAVPGHPSAAYFTLHGGTEPARLVAVASPSAGDIELHDSMASAGGPSTGSGQGMTTMTPLDGVDVAAGAAVAFAPGGKHAMVYGLAPNLAPGGTVKLSFRFAKGQPQVLDARAVAAGDPSPY